MIKNVLFFLFLSSFFPFSFAQTKHLDAELLWQLGRVSLDDVSPDGQNVLYGVTYYDLEKNKGNRDLYLVPASGGEVRQLTQTEASESNGRFLPGGQKIAFLRKGQIVEYELETGIEKTVYEGQVNGFSYSPAAKHLLFVQDVKYEKPVKEQYEDLPQVEARVIDDLMYRHWNAWHDYKYSNIFIAEYTDGSLTGEPVNIMNEPYDSPLQPFGGMEQITWSPDGSAIVYTCKKIKGLEYSVSTNSDLYRYSLEDKKTVNLTSDLPGYDMEPAFSPDGRYIAWNSMRRDGFESDRNRIFLFDTQDGSRRELTEGWDMSAGHPRWSEDGSRIYFRGGVKATYQLFALDIATGRREALTEGIHNYYAFLPAGKALIASRATMSMPHELFRVDLENGEQEPITFTNKSLLEDLEMGKVEQRWIETSDGKRMLVWMIYPPGFDPAKEYPSLLYCQGGPQSAVSQFWSYRWNFQLMAAHGYVVVAPNRRGLPTFGREWNDQISGDWGGQAMQDLLTAADRAKEEPFIDDDRMGAVGASFGGYSVYWLAGNHEKRFNAFISHCGLFNLESWYGTTEELFFANFDLEGPYWQEKIPETYLEDSPHRYVQNWDTPLLVIHCEKDYRVPIGEGMQAFQAAKVRGIPARFLYFPDEGHWVLKPQNGLLWHRVFFDWLETYLKDEKP